MINALVIIKTAEVATSEMQERIRGQSLANTLQLIYGAVQTEVFIKLEATSITDLNVALGELSELSGVKSVSVVHIFQES